MNHVITLFYEENNAEDKYSQLDAVFLVNSITVFNLKIIFWVINIVKKINNLPQYK